MKYILFLAFFFTTVSITMAQTNNGVTNSIFDIKEPVQNKKGVSGNELKASPYVVKSFQQTSLADSATIVSINGKIYPGNSKEYYSLDFSTIISFIEVKDDSTASKIKRILIIKTKPN